LGLHGAQAATLLPDGDFAGSGNPFQTIFLNQNFGATNKWTVTKGSVDWIGDYWQSPSGIGGGSVDLDGLDAGTISQSLTLAPGTYTVTFALSGNPDGLPTTKLLEVNVNGAQAQGYSY
ncbi:unnamed protein product, partial [Phaeothamnion confervicola]